MNCSSVSNAPELPKIFERDVCTISEPNVISMNIMFSHKNRNIEDLFDADTPVGRYNRRRVISNATAYPGMGAEADNASSACNSIYSKCSSEDYNNNNETQSLLTLTTNSKHKGIRKRRQNRSRSSSIRSLKSMVSGIFSTKTKSLGA
ncbi:hypothetical protein LPJ64_000680 [Coemansia asiatica]|uniref:Uncharacterized protein n=1 Tax=Coemansia asiatica TaxID=1052880 RepID=A0A9W7XRI2_9FUNG|nr:hypothetical protein LPJ64_000680 [Coemansia asiatica]KAJ2878271.1 hypothetical protein FB639_003443 [Coemansia asiatica]